MLTNERKCLFMENRCFCIRTWCCFSLDKVTCRRMLPMSTFPLLLGLDIAGDNNERDSETKEDDEISTALHTNTRTNTAKISFVATV